MLRSPVRPALFCLILAPLCLQAQEFKIDGREVQIHGFASQGFIYTDENNWLTMHTSQGSGAFTDFGANVSMQVTDKLRIGAQGYDRNLGNLGEWHPSVDWAVVDYRFRNWLGFRGGKVKTTLGLYNDTQDLDFLRTFALLPQSIYPTDVRDATIAHLGSDIYGTISLQRHLGDLSYTAYAGHRSDSLYDGYTYLASQYDVHYSRYGGLQYGADLRWNTPLQGLLVGVSRMNEDLTGNATFISPYDPSGGLVPYTDASKADWTNQFYGEFTTRKLRVDSEYRRSVHDDVINGGILLTASDIRGWYVSGTYHVVKRITLGSYYSHYSITTGSGGPLAALFPAQTDISLPANHVYDKVITARVDLTRFWYLKIEGHFMNGYGESTYPDGFYPQVNPQGFQTDTNALVLKTGFNF
jgi:hypothetical protein